MFENMFFAPRPIRADIPSCGHTIPEKLHPTTKWQQTALSSNFVEGEVQGLDWESKEARDKARARMDAMLNGNIFRMNGRSNYASAEDSKDRKDFYMRAISYCKIPSITNSHPQIHFNFRAFSPCDYYYPDDRVGFMHLNTQRMKSETIHAARGVVAMDFFENKIAALSHEPNHISLVDLEHKQCMLTEDFGYDTHQLINCLKFMADDRTGVLKLAVGANTDHLNIFDISNPSEPIESFKVHTNVNYMVQRPNSSIFALAYDANNIDLYDFKSGKQVSRLTGHTDHCFTLDFSPCSYYLASGSQDETTRIWDMRQMRSMKILGTECSASGMVKYTKKGDFLVVGENHNWIHCYETSMNYFIKSSVDFFGELVGFDFSADQKEIYVAIGDSGMGVSGGILRLALGPQMQPILPDELEEY